ncbi:glycosyltransferase [Pedobacter sp.]
MLSVIICTYNPKISYLKQTLAALRSQTLTPTEWELIIVDNNSSNNFAQEIDISWHPNVNIVFEATQGLTPARAKGILSASGNYLLFVDDDNILSKNYLFEIIEINKKWPLIGAFGGSIQGIFEIEPEAWTKDYWYYLALRDVEKDYWSNDPNSSKAEPCGAGLCIRRDVCFQYLENLNNQPQRKRLDRTANSLVSGGDTDMILTALDMGYGMAVFKSLKMQHIIPPERLTEHYLLKLMEGLKYSHIILSKLRGNQDIKYRYDFIDFVKNNYYLFRLKGRAKRFYKAKIRGESKAFRFIEQNQL